MITAENMHEIHLVHLGMSGKGHNVKEAKADAARKIEKVLKVVYVPRLISFRGHGALVWQTPFGCESALLMPDAFAGIRPDMAKHLYGTSYSANVDLDEAEDRARYHLAQVVWDKTEDESPVITNPAIQSEFRTWTAFQKLYRRWKEAGADDAKAFEQASHGIEPMPT